VVNQKGLRYPAWLDLGSTQWDSGMEEGPSGREINEFIALPDGLIPIILSVCLSPNYLIS